MKYLLIIEAVTMNGMVSRVEDKREIQAPSWVDAYDQAKEEKSYYQHPGYDHPFRFTLYHVQSEGEVK